MEKPKVPWSGHIEIHWRFHVGRTSELAKMLQRHGPKLHVGVCVHVSVAVSGREPRKKATMAWRSPRCLGPVMLESIGVSMYGRTSELAKMLQRHGPELHVGVCVHVSVAVSGREPPKQPPTAWRSPRCIGLVL